MSRTLVLLRHAKSSWRQTGTSDFDRRLSGRGVRDGGSFGKRLADDLASPDLVLCSTARRTRDTLAFLVPGLVDPRRVQYEDALYHASAATLLDRIRSVTDPQVRTLMIVGHNPGLTELADQLATGGRGTIENLPTFGCAQFALGASFAELDHGTARLDALLRPKRREATEDGHGSEDADDTLIPDAGAP